MLLAANQLKLPAIAEVVLPERLLSASETDAKHDKFGLVVLEDGSAGFFYRLLAAQAEHVAAYRTMAATSAGLSIASMLDKLASADPFERALAFGVINAATTATFRRTGFIPPEKTPAADSLLSGSCIGMVGYFREQARQLVSQGFRVVVLEINEAIVAEVLNQQPPGITASADPASLKQCDVIYCTASTLINGTVETLLHSLDTELRIELVGPSAGCFPDPLFERGIDVIGGSLVVDTAPVIERVRQGKPWRDSVRKCTLTSATYPGFEALVKS